MIEIIITVIAVNYAVFSIQLFAVNCKYWLELARVWHKTNTEIELKQAESIIRQDAENLAREIDNLMKKEETVVNTEIIIETAKATKVNPEIKQIRGFEPMGIFAITTSDYGFLRIKPPAEYYQDGTEINL